MHTNTPSDGNNGVIEYDKQTNQYLNKISATPNESWGAKLLIEYEELMWGYLMRQTGKLKCQKLEVLPLWGKNSINSNLSNTVTDKRLI